MKRYSPIFLLSIPLAAVLWGFAYLLMPATATSQMMGGDNMQGMRDMMQRMMGDILPPGIDSALLPAPDCKGARLLGHYCAQCHNLPGPGMHTAPEWPAVVARMNHRMQMMSGPGMMGMMMRVEAPSAGELREIVSYLQAHAQRPIDPARYPELATPTGGRSFQTTCARCHALPDPQQHTAEERSGVVARMTQNMAAMGKTTPDEEALGEIVGFLQRGARQSK